MVAEFNQSLSQAGYIEDRGTRWKQFHARLFTELDRNLAVEQLRTVCEHGPVTLLFGSRR